MIALDVFGVLRRLCMFVSLSPSAMLVSSPWCRGGLSKTHGSNIFDLLMFLSHILYTWYRELAVVTTAQLAEYCATTCDTWTANRVEYNNVSLKRVRVEGLGQTLSLMEAGAERPRKTETR